RGGPGYGDAPQGGLPGRLRQVLDHYGAGAGKSGAARVGRAWGDGVRLGPEIQRINTPKRSAELRGMTTDGQTELDLEPPLSSLKGRPTMGKLLLVAVAFLITSSLAQAQFGRDYPETCRPSRPRGPGLPYPPGFDPRPDPFDISGMPGRLAGPFGKSGSSRLPRGREKIQQDIMNGALG